MVASGRAKAARRHVFRDQGNIEDLSPRQQRYINKKINRLTRAIEGRGHTPMYDVRAFPCQMMSGKFAMIPVDAQPEFNDEDGKWYLDGELIVSANYKKKQRRLNKTEAPVDNKKEVEQSIVNMEPEVLGE